MKSTRIQTPTQGPESSFASPSCEKIDLAPGSRLVIVGHFLAGGELRRNKHDFLKALVTKATAIGWQVCVIDNGSASDQELELPESVEIAHCTEYAFKRRGRLELSALFFLAFTSLRLLMQPRTFLECIKAEVYFTLARARCNSLVALKGIASMLAGLGVIEQTIRRHRPRNPNDFLLTFLDLPTLQSLLRREAASVGARMAVMEYGELQNCMFYSEGGLFHQAWPVLHGEQFNSLHIDNDDIERSRDWRRHLVGTRLSNKTYIEETMDLQAWKAGRKLIFLPGLTPVGSCLYPRWTQRSHEVSPIFRSNEDMLREIATVAEECEYCVVYKDHPNTHRFFPHLIAQIERSSHVLVADNVDIHTILDAADMTFTLGGKSAFVSLMRGIPVLLAGPFTLTGSSLVFELKARDELAESVKRVLEGPGVNFAALDRFNARLMRYYLFRLNDNPDGFFPRGASEAAECVLAYAHREREILSCDLETHADLHNEDDCLSNDNDQ